MGGMGNTPPQNLQKKKAKEKEKKEKGGGKGEPRLPLKLS